MQQPLDVYATTKQQPEILKCHSSQCAQAVFLLDVF
jgi:hypothetical protein